MRKPYVDYIKGIGIIFVVLGHINYCNDFIKEWIYAFHMPLFFCATGTTVKQKEIISIRKFIDKKIKSLLVPYVLWGLIYAGYSEKNIISLLYGSYSRISDIGSLSSLWFLPTMFIVVCGIELVEILVYRFNLADYAYLIILVSSVIVSELMTIICKEYPFCLNVAVMAMAFTIFGYLWEKWINKTQVTQCRIFMPALCVLGFLGTLTYKLNSINQDGYVLMANMSIGNPLAFFFTALMGFVMVYAIARMLDCGKGERKILSFLGKNTLIIFATHKPLIVVFKRVFNFVNIPSGFELLLVGAAVLLVSSVLCVIINHCAPCLGGKV